MLSSVLDQAAHLHRCRPAADIPLRLLRAQVRLPPVLAQVRLSEPVEQVYRLQPVHALLLHFLQSPQLLLLLRRRRRFRIFLIRTR
jgi:hypothetical protein